MPLVTTTIGAWPKPDYVRLPGWFAGQGEILFGARMST